jgi:hypothetical protein
MSDPVIKLTYDSLLSFGTESALGASADATNILQIGSNERLLRFALVADITAHKISATDEALSIVLELSKSADMSNPVTKTTEVIENETTAVGRRYYDLTNDVAGERYKYCRVAYVVGGSSPATDLECYLAPIPKV